MEEIERESECEGQESGEKWYEKKCQKRGGKKRRRGGEGWEEKEKNGMVEG